MRTGISMICALGLSITGCATKSTPNAAFPSDPQERRLLLAHSIPVGTPQGATYEVRVYIVQSGDTFGTIAQRFHLREEELLALNPGVRPKLLRTNERLVIYEETK